MYTPLSDIELVDLALQCYTVDGAYFKLCALQLEREEFLEEVLAYNKREQSESVVALSISNDTADTFAHKLLAEYHIAELKTRVKFNRIRVDTVRREIDTVSKLKTLLKPHLFYTKLEHNEAKQAAAYDEFVLTKVWTAYTEFKISGNQYALSNLRSLPFDSNTKLIRKLRVAKDELQPDELFEYLMLNTGRVKLLSSSLLTEALPVLPERLFPL